jgi:hypothetical protein
MSKALSSARRQIRTGRAWRLGTTSMLAAGVACAAMAPGAFAATPKAAPKTQTKQYTVSVNPMALASGKTVKATAVITAPEAKVSNWWSQSTVNQIVRRGVSGKGTTFKLQAYSCSAKMKPQSNGSATTNFTCTLRGADVPTGITLTFSPVLRGDTASG